MFQVQVMLSCLDINTFTIRTVVHKPNIGDKAICKVCHETGKVIQVGKPYPVIEKATTKR